jgi:hypothetical protein
MFLLSFLSSLIIASFTYIKGNVRSIIVLLLIVSLSLFAGISTQSVDYGMYRNLFESSVISTFDPIVLLVQEPSFFIIPLFCHAVFGPSYYINVSFLIFAFLGVSTKILAIKDSRFFFLSVALYCCYSYFFQEMITIRAGVASGIFLLAIKDLDNKNDKGYFLKILLALLFHYSSIIFVLIWVLVRLKLSLKVFYSFLAASFAIALLKINLLVLLRLDLLIPKVKIYLDLMELEGNVAINLFNYRILISLFMLFLFAYKIKVLEDEPYFLTLFKIHLLSLILFFVLSTSAIVFSDRTFDLLAIVQVLLYPFIILIFKERFVGYLILFLICSVNLFFIVKISGLFDHYTTWLF